MKPQVQALISKANTLVAEAIAKGERRRRYPPELKEIVRSLVLNHKFSVPQAIAVIPISTASVRSWTKKKKQAKQALPFKKISIEKFPQNIEDKNLKKITAALVVLIASQVLLLALNLFRGQDVPSIDTDSPKNFCLSLYGPSH